MYTGIPLETRFKISITWNLIFLLRIINFLGIIFLWLILEILFLFLMGIYIRLFYGQRQTIFLSGVTLIFTVLYTENNNFS